jgi:hypothetical protein
MPFILALQARRVETAPAVGVSHRVPVTNHTKARRADTGQVVSTLQAFAS